MIKNKDVKIEESTESEEYTLHDFDGTIISAHQIKKNKAPEELVDFISRVEHDEIHGFKNDNDVVNKPVHYNNGSMETIDKIDMMIGDKNLKPMEAMCLGNVIKYIDRHQFKGRPIEDIKKAVWYLNKYIKLMEVQDD